MHKVTFRFPESLMLASFSNTTQLAVLILATISQATTSAPPLSITRQAQSHLDCGVKNISGSFAGEINRILRTQG